MLCNNRFVIKHKSKYEKVELNHTWHIVYFLTLRKSNDEMNRAGKNRVIKVKVFMGGGHSFQAHSDGQIDWEILTFILDICSGHYQSCAAPENREY